MKLVNFTRASTVLGRVNVCNRARGPLSQAASKSAIRSRLARTARSGNEALALYRKRT